MNPTIFRDRVVLVTGGTGSFGREFVKTLLQRYQPKKVIVFSRDELKQYEMQQQLNADALRYFIGDIRDKDRLKRAMQGVDIVVHTAALKQVPSCEYNPFEAVKTNVFGAENIIDAAIDAGVKQVIALSTDKAVNPVNLYGSTSYALKKCLSRATPILAIMAPGLPVVAMAMWWGVGAVWCRCF